MNHAGFMEGGEGKGEGGRGERGGEGGWGEVGGRRGGERDICMNQGVLFHGESFTLYTA